MQTHILSLHTPSTPKMRSKGQHFYLKVVMLHIKLKGIEHRVPCTPCFDFYFARRHIWLSHFSFINNSTHVNLLVGWLGCYSINFTKITVNLEIFEMIFFSSNFTYFYAKFRANKPSRNGEISLSFTDIGKQFPSFNVNSILKDKNVLRCH